MKKNSKLFKPIGDFSNLDEFVSLCSSSLTQICHLVIHSTQKELLMWSSIIGKYVF